MDVVVKIDVVTGDQKTNWTGGVEVTDGALNAVLFDFNPTANPAVTRIKALHAALITEMETIRSDPSARDAQKRAAAIAITELEGTQMRAVKALFAK